MLGSSMSNFFKYVKFFKKWANVPRSPPIVVKNEDGEAAIGRVQIYDMEE